MIVIVNKLDDYLDHYIHSVWDTVENAEERYCSYLVEKGSDLGLVINPHWCNVMDREKYHKSLTEDEFWKAEKEYKEFLRKHTIEWYIEHKLGGRKLEHKTINS